MAEPRPVYDEQSLIELLREAGIPEKDIPMMVAIAMAESKGDANAVGDKGLVDEKWNESIGLFQIRSLKNPNDYSEEDKLRVKEKLFDPIYNIKAAYAISKQGKDWSDWSTFEDKTYRDYLPSRMSRKYIKIAGGGRGSKGKPITMADTENNVDLTAQESKDLNKQIYSLTNEIKKLKTKNKQVGQNLDATIASKESELEKLKSKREAYKTGRETKYKKAMAEEAKTKEEQKLADIEAEIARVEREGTYKTVPGQRGPVVSASKSYLEGLKTRRDILKGTITAEPTTTPAETPVVETTTPTDAGAGLYSTASQGGINGVPQQAFNAYQTPIYTGETEVKNVRGRKGEVSFTKEVPSTITANDYITQLRELPADELAALQKSLKEAGWITGTYVSGVLDPNTQKDVLTMLKTIAEYNDPKRGISTFIRAAGGIGDGTGLTSKQLNGQKENIKLYAEQLGVQLTDKQISTLTTTSLLSGWDSSVLKTKIAQTGQLNFESGLAAQTLNSLKSLANDYGVMYGDDFYRKAASDILMGKGNTEEVKQQFIDMAKATYPTLAAQLDKNYTVKQLASPYVQAMSNVLELGADSISLNDPTIRQALTSIDDKGNPMLVPLWKFEQDLRKNDPRWRYTKNAEQAMAAASRKVLQDFGLAY